MTTIRMPGLDFQVRPRRQLPAPLRSDVAGFIGRARRGPIERAVRVEGWRGYLREFGGLISEAYMPYAVRGYFENGGEIAHIVRVAGRKTVTAKTVWDVTDQLVYRDSSAVPIVLKHAFAYRQYKIVASSPGVWGSGITVSLRYERVSNNNQPRLDMTIRAEDEPDETIRNLSPWLTPDDEREGRGPTMMSRVASESRLIRIEPVAGTELSATPTDLGPGHQAWAQLSLSIPALPPPEDRIPTPSAYATAIQELGDQTEIAFSAVPDLDHDAVIHPITTLQEEGSTIRREVVHALSEQAARLQDRVVLVDTPGGTRLAGDAVSFADRLHRKLADEPIQRAAAVYHPWLRVPDPLGGPVDPLKTVPPCGHVAGVYSRMDRLRGAHHTPANVTVFDAVDIESMYQRDDLALFNVSGVNPLICRSGRGLTVWGGRTLDRSFAGRFVAHRRFIQRLVRSIRRVAEPLVFENNLPGLWLTLIRAVSSVLMEAWRGGALRGDRVDDAFQVRCDEETNPPESRDVGRVVCEIKVALAAPMEFITLRVALSESGQVEVFDT